MLGGINMQSIFDVITESAINERLDNTILQNEEYIKIQNKISENSSQLDKLNLTKEELLVIDRLVCSHAESGAFYGKMTYRQGFKDCASLLKDMDLIKDS